MSTNPGSVIGTNAAYGGRTSVKAFNDDLAMLLGAGILSGWECSPKTEMTIQLGGNGSARDVAVAENASGDRITINNRSDMPIEVTIDEAPESGSRIDLVVAYVNDPPASSGTYVDNPDACGLIVVSGAASETPAAPTENSIRTAITLDGASGETAFYVVLASVTVRAGITNITADDISAGKNVSIKKTIVIDKTLSTASDNPIANKAVKQAVDNLDARIKTVDQTLSLTSTNPIANKAVKQAVDNLDAKIEVLITVDDELNITSSNAIANRAVTQAINNLNSATNAINTELKAYEGSNEAYVIAANRWTEGEEAIKPFKYSATVTATHTLTVKTIVELINNNAVKFANYGFSIGGIAGQVVTIYSFDLPEEPISLTISYKEVA